MSAWIPWTSRARRVSSGYSVLTRRRAVRAAAISARSSMDEAGESAPTASTMRAGFDVAFE